MTQRKTTDSNVRCLPNGRRQARILGTWVDDLTVDELVDQLFSGTLFTLNPDHLYHLQRNPAFASAYNRADFVSADSKYVYWALTFLGRPIRQKCSGSDIVPAFWRKHASNPRISIFLLGAKPGIAQQARERINKLAGREIVIGAHGPSMSFVDDPTEIAQVITMINRSGANVLIVGLGAPKQEIWIDRYRAALPAVNIFMGVGATIDYEAEAVKRAPRWMANRGLEWVYRVVTEPRRYWRRYFRTTEFFWLVMLDRLGLYRLPRLPQHGAANRPPR
jgi:exopolysaccharide biosynthesis WecB/TagA/CpsF family protein